MQCGVGDAEGVALGEGVRVGVAVGLTVGVLLGDCVAAGDGLVLGACTVTGEETGEGTAVPVRPGLGLQAARKTSSVEDKRSSQI
jgi:hypothetical protein